MAVNVVFLQPVIALIAGILILIIPRLLNYIVAICLILVVWPVFCRMYRDDPLVMQR